jgi:hypothetical protein
MKAVMGANHLRRLFVIALMLYGPSNSFGNGPETPYAKAEIYYYGWDVLTRGRLSLEQVRTNPRIKTVILNRHEVTSFLRTLEIDKMTKSKDGRAESGDPRLVVDFWDWQGARRTYYSDGALLYSEDGLQWRKIGRDFRQSFTFSRVR